MDKEEKQTELVKIVLNEQSMVVLRTMSKDEDRPYMMGVYLDVDGSMVSTDGHRLSKVTRPENASIDLKSKPLENGKGILLSRNVVEGMAKDLKGQRKSISPLTQHITYQEENSDHSRKFNRRDTMGDREYKVLLLDEKFPPYEDVIPKSQPEDQTFSINIDYLLDMARQAKEFMRGSEKGLNGCQVITFHIGEGKLEPIKAECRHKETGQVLTHILMPLRL